MRLSKTGKLLVNSTFVERNAILPPGDIGRCLHRCLSSKVPKTKSSSTSEDDAVAKSRYLQTWLGNDMSGQGYLEQIVKRAQAEAAAKKAMASAGGTPPTQLRPATQQHFQQQILQQQKYEQMAQTSVSNDKNNFAAAASVALGPGVSLQHVQVPVIHIDFSSSIDSIKNTLSLSCDTLDLEIESGTVKSSAGAKVCVLDFDSIKEETSLSLVTEVLSIIKGIPQLKAIAAINVPKSWEATLSAAQVPSIPSSTVSSPTAHQQPQQIQQIQQQQQQQPPPQQQQQQQQQQHRPMTTAESSKPLSTTHYGVVRSGQQLYAEGSSLIVVGSVNSGGEVLADGDIHIYGALQGRAVAGLGGNATAKVFMSQFNASLIGIADSFIMVDDNEQLRPLLGKAVCVRLGKSSDKAEESAKTVTVNCGGGNSLIVSVLN